MKEAIKGMVYGLWSIVHWVLKTAIDCVWLMVALISKVIASIGSIVAVLLTQDVHGFRDFKGKLREQNQAVNLTSNIGLKAYMDLLYPFDEEEP